MKTYLQELERYTNSEYPLTKNEALFIKTFLSENGCGAKTPKDLLADNFSCQCIEDLRDTHTGLSNDQIGGYISSLIEKGVLWLEVRDGAVCKYPIGTIQESIFAPNLYWVDDCYLETLDENLKFYSESTEAKNHFED